MGWTLPFGTSEWAGVCLHCVEGGSPLLQWGTASSCRGPGLSRWAWQPAGAWGRREAGCPQPRAGPSSGTSRKPLCNTEASRTDSSLLLPVGQRVGSFVAKTTAMMMTATGIYYMFSMFWVTYSMHLACIAPSNPLHSWL
uniref:Uncharacterized protein n=1 Tax=Pipistrellus kuhlii TaxID=59472 RepID=A0A7J8A848_PIPKU|nr:hypothetical protein mPipKuh1_009027 [Pipistrellus kuhlii]